MGTFSPFSYFWVAFWCSFRNLIFRIPFGSCGVEMPQLQMIQKELEPKGVHFAAVSLDTRNRQSSVEAYIKKEKVTLPVYRDPEGTLAKRFQVRAIPTTVVLDQNAEIYYRTKGYRRGDEILLKKKIQALMRPEDTEPAPEKSDE